MKSLFILIAIPLFLSVGCATRGQLKDLKDEIAKEMEAQKQAQAIPEPTVRPNESDWITMDDLNRALTIHKRDYPHGCDCK